MRHPRSLGECRFIKYSEDASPFAVWVVFRRWAQGTRGFRQFYSGSTVLGGHREKA